VTTQIRCPLWCAQREGEEHDYHNDEQHGSALWCVDLSAGTLFLELSARLDAAHNPTVDLVRGDTPLLSVQPAQARSVAAGLLRLADIAEGGMLGA